jgi:hypothetical protein
MDKFNFTTKLHLACSDDPLRPIMNCVHFTGGFAYASNGHIAIKQSLEYHSVLQPGLLEGKSIHRDNYKNIMQFETATANDEGVQCSNADGREAFFSYFDMKGENMPVFDAVFKRYHAAGVTFIGMNPEQMKIIMEAMYTPDGYVRVNFGGIDKAMILDVPGVPNQEGMVMPVLVEASLF